MSKRHFLEFEQPIADLESKIEELRYVQSESAVDISEEIDRLSKKSLLLTKDIYSSLSPWQVTQIARHPQRPYTLDYVNELFTDFQEMHGDRHFSPLFDRACRETMVGHPVATDFQQMAEVNWLRDKIVTTGSETPEAIFGHCVRRECDNRTREAPISQFLGGTTSVQDRHLHIHQD